MNERMQDRLFAGCGIASVGLMLAGVLIGAAGGREFATVSSTRAQIAHALAKPAGTAVWVGAYIEILSFGCFLAFAIWATRRLGGGLFGAIANAIATSYATLSIASLAFMDGIEYRAGHGIGTELARTLITINQAIFVGTWFLSVFFLLATAPLALTAGRRALGYSAIAIAATTLLLTAVSLDNLAQMANFLWLAWIIATSITLARKRRDTAPATVAAQHA
jgi:hypothetical protein